MAKQNISYEDILNELESIVSAVERGDLEIAQLTRQLKRAQTLLAQGKEQLQKVKNDVQNIFRHEHE